MNTLYSFLFFGVLLLGFCVNIILILVFMKKMKKERQENKKSSKFIIRVCFFSAAFALGISLFFTAEVTHFIATSKTSTGYIVDNIEEKNKDGEISYSPVFEYYLPDNTKKIIDSKVKGNIKYKIGEEVPIRYCPKDTSDARINSFSNLWAGSIGFLIMSFIFFTIGYVKKLKYHNKEEES